MFKTNVRHTHAGADPGFPEMGVIRILALLILSHFYYISHENEIIWSKLFHFHRMFENGGGGTQHAQANTLNPLRNRH